MNAAAGDCPLVSSFAHACPPNASIDPPLTVNLRESRRARSSCEWLPARATTHRDRGNAHPTPGAFVHPSDTHAHGRDPPSSDPFVSGWWPLVQMPNEV